MSTSPRNIQGYSSGTPTEAREGLGITKFYGEFGWSHPIAGLVFQGGKIAAAGEVEFHDPYGLQLLFISLPGGSATSPSLAGFTASAPGYWFAIGV